MSQALSDSPGVILLVEDFDQLRTLTAGLLRGAGYNVVDVGNGPEALPYLSNPGLRLNLLITDLRMPAMNGFELIIQSQELRPGLPVLIMSGYSTEPTADESRSLSHCRFLQKPCAPAEILDAVRKSLAGPR